MTLDLEVLVSAGIQRQLRARPGAWDEMKQLTTDETGRAVDTAPPVSVETPEPTEVPHA